MMPKPIETTVTIRSAEPEDRLALVRFLAGLNAFEHRYRPDRALGEAAADAHLAYLERLAAEQDGFLLVAERAGTPIGFILAVVEQEGGAYVVPQARSYGYVTDLYVAPEARGQGAARALFAEAEQRVRAKGLACLRVTALAANTGARRTYEALGYAPLEVTYEKPLGGE